MSIKTLKVPSIPPKLYSQNHMYAPIGTQSPNFNKNLPALIIPSFLPLPFLVNTLLNLLIAKLTPSACNGDNFPSLNSGNIVVADSSGTDGADTDDNNADSTAGDV